MSVRSLRIALRLDRSPSVCCKALLSLVSKSPPKRKQVAECIVGLDAMQSLSSRLLWFSQQLARLHKACQTPQSGPSSKLAACAAFVQPLRVHCLVFLHHIRTSCYIRCGFWTWASAIEHLSYSQTTRLHEVIHVTIRVRGRLRVARHLIGVEECWKSLELEAYSKTIQIVWSGQVHDTGNSPYCPLPRCHPIRQCSYNSQEVKVQLKLTWIRAKGTEWLHDCIHSTPAHACAHGRMSRSVQESAPWMQYRAGLRWPMSKLVAGATALLVRTEYRMHMGDPRHSGQATMPPAQRTTLHPTDHSSRHSISH